jgi:hypothetical protein
MLKSIKGVYRNGKIDLIESHDDISDETQVIVTFLESPAIDLRSRGINEVQAADLQARLATFAEDWSSPEMDLYNDYDAAQSNL